MKKTRRFLRMAGVAGMCLALAGCSSKGTEDTKETAEDVKEQAAQSGGLAEENNKKAQAAIATVSYKGEDRPKADCKITLKGDDAECDGSGAEFKDGVLTISKAGCYEITGSLSDGRIEVDATKDDKVEIILNGVDVTCSNYAPFVVWQADDTLIYLEEGTQNIFTDGESYHTLSGTTEDDTPTAACFSKDKLVFDGEGSLTINASCNDGITGKDDVWFENGTFVITAKDDGIVGKDSVTVKDGTYTIDAQGDGIKSTHDTDELKGFVYILDGTFDITSACDGIQGETYVWAEGGTFRITSGGGSGNVTSQTGMMDRRGDMSMAEAEDSTSMKGVKAGVHIMAKGGTWNMDCADDTVHSNSTITVEGGIFEVMTGDDGFHADDEIDIKDGELTVAKSYEGIEAESIIIRGGDISVTASDDGLNAANGESAEGMDGPGGMGGQPGENSSSTGLINIEGGTIYVNASGDGVDSNGSINMSGGTVYVDGPTNDGDGFLDYDKEFLISGGTFVAVGSGGMMQTTSENSEQPAMAVGMGQTVTAGTELTVQDSSGKEIISYAPSKDYAAAVISSPDLKLNETYDIYIDGTKSSSIELTSVSTTDGSVRIDGQPGGMGGNRGQKGGRLQDGGMDAEGQGGAQPPEGEMPDPEEWDGTQPQDGGRPQKSGGQRPDVSGAGVGQERVKPDGTI